MKDMATHLVSPLSRLGGEKHTKTHARYLLATCVRKLPKAMPVEIEDVLVTDDSGDEMEGRSVRMGTRSIKRSSNLAKGEVKLVDSQGTQQTRKNGRNGTGPAQKRERL